MYSSPSSGPSPSASRPVSQTISLRKGVLLGTSGPDLGDYRSQSFRSLSDTVKKKNYDNNNNNGVSSSRAIRSGTVVRASEAVFHSSRSRSSGSLGIARDRSGSLGIARGRAGSRGDGGMNGVGEMSAPGCNRGRGVEGPKWIIITAARV